MAAEENSSSANILSECLQTLLFFTSLDHSY